MLCEDMMFMLLRVDKLMLLLKYLLYGLVWYMYFGYFIYVYIIFVYLINIDIIKDLILYVFICFENKLMYNLKFFVLKWDSDYLIMI